MMSLISSIPFSSNNEVSTSQDKIVKLLTSIPYLKGLFPGVIPSTQAVSSKDSMESKTYWAERGVQEGGLV